MKTLIIGAHGKVGKELTKKLKSTEGFTPVAFIRDEDQRKEFQKMDVDCVVSNLEAPAKELSEAVKGFDAIVFTAGSGGNTGLDKTLSVDLDGAAKAIEAAQNAGVKRFVMVSASGSDDREFWEKSGIKPYYIAKHYADRILKESNLDYTILRPVRLTDESGEGKIKAATSRTEVNSEIPREDVAEAILESLRNQRSIGKVIEISSGNKKVAEALEEAMA